MMDRSEALNLFQGLDAMMNNKRPRAAARKIINLIYDEIEKEEADIIDIQAIEIEVKSEQL